MQFVINVYIFTCSQTFGPHMHEEHGPPSSYLDYYTFCSDFMLL